MLIWYQLLDVKPFMEALQKGSDTYSENFGLDMFKDGLSVPGLSMKYLFSTVSKPTFFSLISDEDRDLHETFRKQIVGGPSIVFHRYHEKGETQIRGIPNKDVEQILGLDANALYLYSLSQAMPTGGYTRFKKVEGKDKFIPKMKSLWNQMEEEWLQYRAYTDNVDIQSRMSGKQAVFEHGNQQFLVDGYCAENNTVYEFHGCWWHGHKECKPHKHTGPHPTREGYTFEQLFEETEERSRILRDELGLNVEEIFECQWTKMKRSHHIQAFLKETFPENLDYYFPKKKQKKRVPPKRLPPKKRLKTPIPHMKFSMLFKTTVYSG